MTDPIPLFHGNDQDLENSTIYIGGYLSSTSSLETPELTLKSFDGILNTLVLHTFIGKGLSGGPAVVDGAAFGVVQARDTDTSRTYIIPFSGIKDFLTEQGVFGRTGAETVPGAATFQIESLPAHFVPRRELVSSIREKLLHKDSTGRLCLKGLGGIGKTTIARACCWEFREIFEDGILWATLGQSPEILPKLHEWLFPFSEKPPSFESVNAACAHLRSVLQNRRVLLVIDDVWNAEELQSFLVGGPPSRTIITTRDGRIAQYVDAELIEVDLLSETVARQLLKNKLNHIGKLPTDEEIDRLSSLLGYLPLALEISAIHLEEGLPISLFLEELSKEIGRLAALEVDAPNIGTDQAARRFSVNASLNLSLKTLSLDQLNQFLLLGLFRRQGSITRSGTAILLGVSPFQTQKFLNAMVSKSLLMPIVHPKDGVVAYRMHDLVYDKCQTTLLTPTKEAKIIEGQIYFQTIEDGHKYLVNNIKRSLGDGLWSELRADEYTCSNLFYHLNEARDLDSMFTVLDGDAVTGPNITVANAWLLAQEQVGAPTQFIADVEVAWQLAETKVRSSWESSVVHLDASTITCLDYCIRAACIFSSVAGRSAGVTLALAYLLIDNQVWTAAQTLYAVGRTLRPRELLDLGLRLPGALRNEAVELALTRVLYLFDVGDGDEKNRQFAQMVSMFYALPSEYQQAAKKTIERRTQFLMGKSHGFRVFDDQKRTLSFFLQSISPLDEKVGKNALEYMIRKVLEKVIQSANEMFFNPEAVSYRQKPKSFIARAQPDARARQTLRGALKELAALLHYKLWSNDDLTSITDCVVKTLKENAQENELAQLRQIVGEESLTALAGILNQEDANRLFDYLFSDLGSNSKFDAVTLQENGGPTLGSRLERLVEVAAFCDESRALCITRQLLADELFRMLRKLFSSSQNLSTGFLDAVRHLRIEPELWLELTFRNAVNCIDGEERNRRLAVAVDYLENTVPVRRDRLFDLVEQFLPFCSNAVGKKLVHIFWRTPYGRRKVQVAFRVREHLDTTHFQELETIARDVADHYGNLLMKCLLISIDQYEVSTTTGPELAAVARSIPHPEEIPNTITEILGTTNLPNDVTRALLEVALEAAQGIRDDEPLLISFARVASLAGARERSLLLQAAPILSGVTAVVIRADERRGCTGLKLRSLVSTKDPSESEGNPTYFPTSALARFSEVPRRDLSERDLADQLLKSLRRSVAIASRAQVFSEIGDWVEELAVRGHTDIAAAAACTMHDCYRWWP